MLVGDVGARAGLVFDDHLLAEDFGELGREQARVDVDAAAGGEADDEAHGAGGIGLGERIGGHGKSDGEQEETHAGNVAQ